MHKSASECTKAVVGDVVAGRTVLVRRYMTNRLTNTDITVMAGQAVVGICAGVVKRHSSKVSGVMANRAVLIVGTGWYVIWQLIDTNHIIVAGVTVTSNTGMVIGTSAKGSWSMTNFAVFDDVDIDDVERHVLV